MAASQGSGDGEIRGGPKPSRRARQRRRRGIPAYARRMLGEYQLWWAIPLFYLGVAFFALLHALAAVGVLTLMGLYFLLLILLDLLMQEMFRPPRGMLTVLQVLDEARGDLRRDALRVAARYLAGEGCWPGRRLVARRLGWLIGPLIQFALLTGVYLPPLGMFAYNLAERVLEEIFFAGEEARG